MFDLWILIIVFCDHKKISKCKVYGVYRFTRPQVVQLKIKGVQDVMLLLPFVKSKERHDILSPMILNTDTRRLNQLS